MVLETHVKEDSPQVGFVQPKFALRRECSWLHWEQ